jgi:hypothetical protein
VPCAYEMSQMASVHDFSLWSVSMIIFLGANFRELI